MVLVAGLYFGQKKIRYEGPQLRGNITFYSIGLVMMPSRSFFSSVVFAVDSLYSTRPITLSNAAEYARVPKDINLVLNTLLR